MKNKISFFLMTYKGFFILKNYLNDFDSSTIDMVIIGRDKNIENDHSEDLKKLCVKNKINYKFNNQNYKIRSNYSFAISWRWLIDQPTKLIVLHDSILPKYRGFAPLVNSLINGEDKIGVTALFASKEYDAGKIIDKRIIKINYPIKISKAIDKLVPLYYQLIKSIAASIIENKKIKSLVQNEKQASYSLWRDEEDYNINWDLDSKTILRFINAVSYPYKGAKSFLGGDPMRILEAEEVADVKIENRSPGKVIFIKNGFPIIVCGKGLLKLKKVKSDLDKKSLIPFKKFRIRLK